MKILFAGTPEFAATALQAIREAGFDIPLVLTQPDRPAGRGMQLQASAVKQYALAHGIPVSQPISLRLDGKYPEEALHAHSLLRSTPHDVMVVAAYGLILPRSILGIPRHGCINIHASLLPRWRGAAPIHRAIEAGDTETGITIMQMDEGLDTGPMLLLERMPIADDDTTGSLHNKLAALGSRLIVEALRELEAGKLSPFPQPESGVSYAPKITKDEAALDFAEASSVILRKIRAFNPFPGAVALLRGESLKIWQAEPCTQEFKASPGEVVVANSQSGIIVACKDGAIKVNELQKPGGKRLPATEFLKGVPDMQGQIFDAPVKRS